MKLNEKLEILIKRNGWKKVDFAEKIGITYRALANYLSADRAPRKAILKTIAENLDVSEEFLVDDNTGLTLDETENFVYNADSDAEIVAQAENILIGARELYKNNGFTENDKRSLFIALTEIYLKEKVDKNNG